MAPGLVARMVFAFAFAIAGTGRAARRPVAVIDLTGAAPGGALATDLYKALVDHAELRPLDNPAFNPALQGPFEDEDAPHLERARRYKQEAEDFLAQLDDHNAQRAATSGMNELALVHPTPQMLGLYADLAFAYGQAQIGLRRPNDAALAFQLASRLDPARHPDPTRYPPNVVQAYDAAANKQTIPAKLAVTGEGRVWIDGVEVGLAGNTFDTSEGLHVVQLTGMGRETRGEQVLVPARSSVQIASAPASDVLEIKRARLALAGARDPAERASAMKRLAKLLGVGDAVLIGTSDGKLAVQTWRDREPGFSALVVYDGQPAREVLAPLAPPSPKIEIRPEPFTPPPIVVEKRWYQKTWVRASIVGGVISGVVSAILYARRDRYMRPWDTDIKPKE
jgi:hypothetical protein